jgi:hypothetical protein
MKVKAPWSDDIVERLKKWQSCGLFHEYNCPECKIPLRVKNDGWFCIGKRNLCTYKQDWAHEPPSVEEVDKMVSDFKGRK